MGQQHAGSRDYGAFTLPQGHPRGHFCCIFFYSEQNDDEQKDTYHTDELRQRHLYGDGDLLALIDCWSDQLVVALRTQQVVHQPLLCILCPAA